MFDRLFHRKRPVPASASVEHAEGVCPCPACRAKARHLKHGQFVTTGRGGPNMPRYQPCPDCGRWVRRQNKTGAGADYYCTKCQAGNFVRAR